MSFIELLSFAMALDFAFFIDLIMNNLFWVFGFFAAGYIFSNGKTASISGFLFAGMILVSLDIFNLINFSIYTASGLMILYLVRVTVILLLENTEGGSKHIPLAWLLSFFFVIGIVAMGWV